MLVKNPLSVVHHERTSGRQSFGASHALLDLSR